MKKFCSALVAALPLFLLCACKAEELGSLEELSRPFAGVYECRRLELGGRDLSDTFDELRLELTYDGAFTISYRMRGGPSGMVGGNYVADPARETITFSAPYRTRTVTRTYHFADGRVLVEENFLGSALYAEFGR